MQRDRASRWPPTALTAFGHRDFRFLWASLMLSLSGQWMQQFVLGWLVVQVATRQGTPQLGSFYLGLVALSNAIPGVLFGLFAGALADRVDRRKVLLFTQSAGGIVSLVLALLTITNWINISLILLVNGLGAIAISFDRPTTQALLPRIVAQSTLLSAVGMVAMTGNISIFFGPLVGGVLIVPLGIGGVMLVNAGVRCAVVALLLFVRPVPVVGGEKSRPNMLHSIVEGLAYATRQPVLRWALLLFGITSIFSRPVGQLMPAIASEMLRVGATQLSWLIAAHGLGAFFGSFLSASLGREGRRGLLGSIFTAAAGLLLIALSYQQLLVPAILLGACIGFAHAMQTNLVTVILQTETPDHFLGRVMSLQSMAQLTFTPLGAAVLGSVGSVVGINYALLFGGGCVALLGFFVLLFVPAIRDLRVKSSAAEAAST